MMRTDKSRQYEWWLDVYITCDYREIYQETLR